ncbi:hypothetical protein M9194_04685 [Vibrio sp. S4M6]|uniref:hypothetical protein n=1 Tax=Vibrio sinus TaxID=2946865 RepID=UPI00202A874A|nr:hypothetical protein [Vibrio sinus]MCL9780733.1 hypothetical protein [Vibrio sinus]
MKNREVKYIWIAIACACLLIVSHLLLFKHFIEQSWAEYSLAVIPFVLAAIAFFALRGAIKANSGA